MMTVEQAKAFIKPFEPPTEMIAEIERQIKLGERHPWVYTTSYVRSFAEDCAKWFREQGFTTARIVDIYSNSGVRGGSILQIDL